MENIRNYQRELDQQLEQLQQLEQVPRLLLHSCCAPCSSYVLEYLSEYFEITVFYYNPNIYPEEEYAFRAEEQKTFISRLPHKYPIHFKEGTYNPKEFYAMAKGMEQIPEGGERCYQCYEMRLRETARMAKEHRFDFFTTTLSISPLKNARWLNEIGERVGKEFGVAYLVSDFKKKNGYKRSVELSRAYEMYRQNYCGCIYSMTKKC
jgi:predicted adenine nucleotide alpha hydrolase (AANH) superfamily ATPase